jgi:hypothetical protein
MTPKTKARRPMSAKEAADRFKATMKRIDAHQRQIDRQNKEMEPLLRELRKIADE